MRTELQVLRSISDEIKKLQPNALEEIRKMGTALIKIADALEGKSPEESLRILESIAALNGIDLEKP